jgi:hypothetical protein
LLCAADAEVLVFVRFLTVLALLHELQVRKGRSTRAFFFIIVDQIRRRTEFREHFLTLVTLQVILPQDRWWMASS